MITPDTPPLRALLADVADAYDRMPSTPHDGATHRAWSALGSDVRADAFTIIAHRIDVYTVSPDAEPYPAAELMHRDIARGRFTVSRANSDGHPLWSAGTNVAFRTAHDIRGHFDADQSGFDWIGELAACASHGTWIPDAGARRALFVECIMQTGTAIARGAFPAQKVNAFPERYMSRALGDAFAQWLADPRRY